MAISKSDNAMVMTRESIEYLVGLIRDLANVSEGINDISITSSTTFSSYKIDILLKTLKSDCNDYADKIVANLSRLELKVVTDESEMTEHNKLYLIKKTGETSYSEYVIVTNDSGVDEKILLGTCDISMDDYLKITDADNKFALKTDLQDVINAVNDIKTEIGTETLNTTSQELKGAINEVKDTIDNFESSKEISWNDYQKLKEEDQKNGTVYFITNAPDSVDDNDFIVYTSLVQLGLTAPSTTSKIFNAMADNSYLELPSSSNGGTVYVSDFPDSRGILTIRKSNINSFDIQAKCSYGSDISKNYFYLGNLKGSDGTGVTWDKVCITKVKDIAKTNISSKLINATMSSGGGVYYSVKNGICNIQIAGLVASTSGAVIFPNGSLPKTDPNNTNGHYPVTSPNATCGLIVFDSVGAVRYYGNSMTIYATISYPVAES